MENTGGVHASAVTAPAAPRTETERILLGLWTSVLKIDHIGIYDDFLDLEGDSLAALRCVNRIREAFGVTLSFDAFFREPAHIAEVASQIDAMRCEAAKGGGVSRALPG